MTLKGKRNHFNVKLLSGYGLSVRLKDNRLVLTDGYDPFSGEQQKEEWFITQLPYEKLVISGRGYLSTEAISLLCKHYKNIVLTDTFGHPVSLINGVMQSMTATQYRIGQYDTFRNPVKRAYLSRQTLIAKLYSQIKFLKSLPRDDQSETIMVLKENISKIKTSSECDKIEAKSARAYFRYYTTLFDSKFKFESRNQSSLKITKKNASDPINSLCNFGFSVLAGEISKFVDGVGLDPFYGFIHAQHTGFKALVYDLIEPFRWLVESTVYHVANTKDSRNGIRMKDYAWTKDGRVVLSNELKRKFLEKLERNFQLEREYKFKHGRKKRNQLSMCQEITIAKIAVQNLANYCLRRTNFVI